MTAVDGPSSPEDAAQAVRPPIAPIVYRGLTVPYIAAWSSEVSDLTGNPDLLLREHVITGHRHIAYRRERDGDRAHGVLWGRMPDTPGDGQALFAHLHGPRQREVMERGGCQVCAGPGEIWMVPASVWAQHLEVRGEGAPYDTSDPPLCRSCLPIATRQCPNLSDSGYLFLAVRKWSITGVRGYVGDPETAWFGPERDIALHGAPGYDPDRLRLTLAKGLLATLRGITAHTDPERVTGLGRRRGDDPPARGRARTRAARIPAPRRGG